MKDYLEFIESFGYFDEPAIYKGVKIFPVKVKDYKRFEQSYDILIIDKNDTTDIEQIQKSYLRFMFELIVWDETLRQDFLNILELCFGVGFNEEYFHTEFDRNELLIVSEDGDKRIYMINGRGVAFIIDGKKTKIAIQDIELTATDFDELKEIILYQNISGYDNTPMSDDFRKVVQKYYELKNKDIKMPEMIDKIAVVVASTSETYESVRDLPMRMFDKIFECVRDREDYVANTPLNPYLKVPVEHWIYKKDKEKYSDIFGDATSLAKKITSV